MSINHTATENQTRTAPYQKVIGVCKALLKPFRRKVNPPAPEQTDDRQRRNQAVTAAAAHQWLNIFAYCGIPLDSFDGNHGPCPLPGCHGKRSFRFQNRCRETGQLKGMFVCTHCTNSCFEDGYHLIGRYHGIENNEAFKRVAQYLGLSTCNASTILPSTPIKPASHVSTSAPTTVLSDKECKQAKKKYAGEHAFNLLAQCVHRVNEYLFNKGIEDKALVNSKAYPIYYNQANNLTGVLERTTQTVYPNALVIPIYDVSNPEQLIGAQFINKDESRGYLHKTQTTDGIHILEGTAGLPYVAVVEGYATGISVARLTGATVAVAFDANGMIGKAQRLQQLFPEQQLVFFGDNDVSLTGQQAAYTAAANTNGMALVPYQSGYDWDTLRQEQPIDVIINDITHQLAHYGQHISVNNQIVGLSLTSPIWLSQKNKALSLRDTLIHYTGESCHCPLSGGKAIVNAGMIYSFTLKQVILPTLTHLYDANLIAACKELTSSKKRLKWVARHGTQQHIYAFVSLNRHRFGGDLPKHHQFNEWLFQKTGLLASPEILAFIECLEQSRINQTKAMVHLNPARFTHHLQLKQTVQPDGRSRLNWQPALEIAQQSRYKLIAIKAQHGQGKTQQVIKTLMAHANTFTGGVVIAHRSKLIAQIAREIQCYHYEDYHRELRSIGLSSLKGMAICVHSLKHEHFLNYVKEAHSIFIDEASQVLKTLYIDPNFDEAVRPSLVDAAQNAQCLYLTDADLSTEDIHHYQQLFGIKDDDVLIITAEPPPHNFTVNLSCSSSTSHYKTEVIKAIANDLSHNIPCVLAVEAQTQGQSAFVWFKERFPEKNIRLISGKTPSKQISTFIDNIVEESARADLIIYTSVIGTGVSVQHPDQRFKKGYGLFSGNVLNATDCLQMMRRFRDVTTWAIGLLCRPDTMIMASFYHNQGTNALRQYGIAIDPILSQIILNKERQKALFIHAFTSLLHDYNFHIISHLTSDEKLTGMLSTQDIRAEEQEKLLTAHPLPIEQAQRARRNGYDNDTERYRAEAALCQDYFKCSTVTDKAVELWCHPGKREAARRQEQLVALLKGETTLPHTKMQQSILSQAGITLDLFKNQRLTQEAIQHLRNRLANYCSELVGLGFLPERYSKSSRIPEKQPIKFIKEVLIYLGFEVKTKQTTNGDRELDCQVPQPMVSRLNLDVRTDKERLRDQAFALKQEGLSLRQIGEKLGLTKLQTQRLLQTITKTSNDEIKKL